MGVKGWGLAAGIVSAMLVAGCASLPVGPLLSLPDRCAFDAGTGVLELSGDIDAEMAACVAGLEGSGIARVRVNTLGGDVKSALAIADVLDASDPVVEVEAWCVSSCANYFLPVARQVEVARDAVVALHGSMDEGLLKKTAADTPQAVEGLRGLMAAQEGFRVRHGVHKGWLLLRDDYAATPLSPHVEGDVLDFDGEVPERVFAFAVGPAFAESCLPGVEFVWPDPFAYSGSVRRKLDRNGYADTSALRCRTQS